MPGGGVPAAAAEVVVVAGADVVVSADFFWLPHAAIKAVAAVADTPSNASRRMASRRDSRPST
jgi:hypothetical protein